MLGEFAAARHHESFRIDHPAARACGGCVGPVLDHGVHEQVRDARGRFAGAEAQERLLGHRLARDAQRGQDAGDGHRSRALDVVVEAAHPVAVTAQQAERVVIGEVLELHDHARKHFLRGGDEFLDQFVVGIAGDAALAQAEVQGILEQRFVVRADVEHDRQALPRMQARAARVQRKLADGDAHAVRAEVAEPQDAFTVGDDDHRRLPVRPVAHDLRDAPAIGGVR